MADRQISAPSGTINAQDNYILPFDGKGAGTVTIQLKNNAMTGTGIILKARAPGATDWLPIPYIRLNVGGAASDGTTVSTSLTGSGLIQVVVSDGLQLALDATGGISGGSMDFVATFTPLGR